MNVVVLSFIACTSTESVDSAEPIEQTVTEEVPESFEVTGQVLDDEGLPVSEAYVMVGGQPDTMVLTDVGGNFSLWYTNIYLGDPAIVAFKTGVQSTGV